MTSVVASVQFLYEHTVLLSSLAVLQIDRGWESPQYHLTTRPVSKLSLVVSRPVSRTSPRLPHSLLLLPFSPICLFSLCVLLGISPNLIDAL
jgi:hypothetical protein